MNGNKTPLTVFALSLSNLLSRTVLDKTELKGNFNFKLTFAPDFVPLPPGPGDASAIVPVRLTPTDLRSSRLCRSNSDSSWTHKKDRLRSW
jgi:uncharacterized protein (TIGR03435 family)